MRPPVLECREYSFFYGENPVLENINFHIEAGEWLSIVGPNASGKSTLLKNILRLVDGGRASGEILASGKPVADYRRIELARLLAYSPQAGGRIPPFTVRDFAAFSRYPYGWHEPGAGHSECVEQALAMTQTLHIADKRLDHLSGGQRQRAYLAAALAQEAQILLLDEPASFLDPGHALAMNEMLKKLHALRGLTIVAATHDLGLPFDAGGKVLVLAEGKQLFFGPSMDMLANRVLDRAFNHNFSYLEHPKTHKTLVVA